MGMGLIRIQTARLVHLRAAANDRALLFRLRLPQASEQGLRATTGVPCMSEQEMREEAEECRRKALAYLGQPEAPFLLHVAQAFDELARSGHENGKRARPT